MKKSKLTLGLVSSLVSIGALAACNEVTYSDGVVLEYTDAQGNSLKFTAEELFGEQYSTSVASTDFDNVYEVLIRKYYQSGDGKNSLESLKAKAQKDVQDIKDQAAKNADSNKTSYQEEFSKLLSSNNVENVEELYEAKLYEAEKTKFNDDYATNEKIEEMRDGKGVFTKSDTYGIGSDGYLVEQMPYTISHILVKLSSATNGEHAQATITESESRKLGQVIELLAGADISGDGKTSSVTRTSFGVIAQQNSEDTGSATKYGQLSVMDRDQADSFINEFKFGIYAYEGIYNRVNQDETKNPYAAKATAHENSGETYKLIDKIKFSNDATYTDMSEDQTADEEAAGLASGEHFIRNYFSVGAGRNIGLIPYGAAVALAKDDVAKNAFTIDGTDTKMSWEVNNNSSTFFPRNILFNKYFNNHRVAVIIPNEIAYNKGTSPLSTADDYTTEDFVGTPDADYAALAGFSRNTTDVLPKDVLGLADDTNVLTTEKGQIILAVRGGSSGSYEGIHFMVIDRSALEQYVKIEDTFPYSPSLITEAEYNASKDNSNANSLSEFYTIYKPDESAYPTYNNGADKKTTYVNQLHTTTSAYGENAKAIKDKIKSYNSNKDTYLFQELIEGGSQGSITFANNDVAQSAKKLIQEWIASKREKSVIDSAESFDKTWATYIEYLTAQDEARQLNSDGSQRLISETCAIGYNKASSNSKDSANWDSIWKVGGACYAK